MVIIKSVSTKPQSLCVQLWLLLLVTINEIMDKWIYCSLNNFLMSKAMLYDMLLL